VTKKFDENLFLLYDYVVGRGNDRAADNELCAPRFANRKGEMDLIGDILLWCHTIEIGAPVTEEKYLEFLNIVLINY
jgi:hypothetical protein